MKKVTILGAALILLLILAACSSSNNASNEYAMTDKAGESDQMKDQMVMPADEAKPVVEPDKKTDVVVEPEKAAAEKVTPEKAESEKAAPKEEPATTQVKPEPAKEPVAEPAPTTVAKTYKVDISNFAYSPDTLEIHVGDIVEFTNLDDVKHSATEDNGVFDTGLLAKGASKQITFNDTGEFPYHCIPHPYMTAKISVK